MFGVGSPEVRSHMVAGNAFLFPLVLDLADGRGQCGQFYLADQHFFLAGGSIHIPQFTCSPESSRWMKENLVLSGLHLIVSGPRPVMPPSAKIASIVSGSFPARSGSGDWAIAQEISTVKTTVRGTNRFMRKLQGTRLAISRVEKCTPSGRMMQKACSRCRAKSPRSHAKITIVPSE